MSSLETYQQYLLIKSSCQPQANVKSFIKILPEIMIN